MRIAFVTYGLPSETSNGGPMTCWGIISHLLRHGHHVTACVLLESTDPFRSPKLIERIRSLGADVEIIEHDRLALWNQAAARGATSPGRTLKARIATLAGRPELARYYPWAHLKPQVAAVLDRARPDVVFCYHFEALAAAHGLTDLPKVAGVGDLYHLPNYYRWKMARPKLSFRYALGGLSQWRLRKIHQPLMLEMMAECRARGAFAAHYAAWFREHGLTDTRYFHTPVGDPLFGKPAPARGKARRGSTKPRILMIGDLTSTVTTSGLRMFAHDVLPALERRFGPDGFEVHIVGGGAAPEDIAEHLGRPSIRFRGRIDPPDDEFLSADVLLVPTPIELGIRVRAVTGFAFGNCIVIHPANRCGIPEIADGQNALVASTGEGMAAAVERVISDEHLRTQLTAGGRRTYEENFAIDVAAASIRIELEKAAGSARVSGAPPRVRATASPTGA